jgi:hypothetical protein
MKEGGVIASDASRHPIAPLHPSTPGGLAANPPAASTRWFSAGAGRSSRSLEVLRPKFAFRPVSESGSGRLRQSCRSAAGRARIAIAEPARIIATLPQFQRANTLASTHAQKINEVLRMRQRQRRELGHHSADHASL